MTNDERELLLRLSRLVADAVFWSIGGSERREEASALLRLVAKVEQAPAGVLGTHETKENDRG